MWSSWFDDGSESGTATVHGVDVSLRRFREHQPELVENGAFARNACVTHEVDTGSDGFEVLAREALPPLDVVIDDGCHTPASQV